MLYPYASQALAPVARALLPGRLLPPAPLIHFLPCMRQGRAWGAAAGCAAPVPCPLPPLGRAAMPTPRRAPATRPHPTAARAHAQPLVPLCRFRPLTPASAVARRAVASLASICSMVELVAGLGPSTRTPRRAVPPGQFRRRAPPWRAAPSRAAAAPLAPAPAPALDAARPFAATRSCTTAHHNPPPCHPPKGLRALRLQRAAPHPRAPLSPPLPTMMCRAARRPRPAGPPQ
ncbi:MAG: hypothetical protein J3K34DRAFT_410675 [Monoraphidium minutum]|nr:MAG: hypothetical protein J3K34DRAFT_410675 [Monoraphidium minutum]